MGKLLRELVLGAGAAAIVGAAYYTTRYEPLRAHPAKELHQQGIPRRQVLRMYAQYKLIDHVILPGDELNRCAVNEGQYFPKTQAYVDYVLSIKENTDPVKNSKGDYVHKILPGNKLNYDANERYSIILPDVNGDGTAHCQTRKRAEQ